MVRGSGITPGVRVACGDTLATAVDDDDWTLAGEAFVLGGGVDVARITITILGLDCGLAGSAVVCLALTDRDFTIASLTAAGLEDSVVTG